MIHKLWNRCVWVVFESIFACITHAHAAAKAGRPQRGLVGGGGTSGNGHQQRLGPRTTFPLWAYVGARVGGGTSWTAFLNTSQSLCCGNLFLGPALLSLLFWRSSWCASTFYLGPWPFSWYVLAFFLARLGILPGSSWLSSWCAFTFCLGVSTQCILQTVGCHLNCVKE